jgi:hypothetical protein
MFPPRYFPQRFFSAGYFPPAGTVVIPPNLPLHLPAPVTPTGMLSAGGLATNNPGIE